MLEVTRAEVKRRLRQQYRQSKVRFLGRKALKKLGIRNMPSGHTPKFAVKFYTGSCWGVGNCDLCHKVGGSWVNR